MKRVLPVVAITAIVLMVPALAVVTGSRAVWKRAGRLAWPMELGSLEDLPARYPKRGMSGEAQRLVALARPVGIDLLEKSPRQSDLAEAIAAYVKAQPAEPPAMVAEFIAAHEREIDAIRDHLLVSRDIALELDVDRGFEAPRPYLLAHLQLGRLLMARALIRARNADARAWDDLRAVTMIDRFLQPRPELVSQLIALHLAEAVSGAASKLPSPVPPWFADVRREDRRRPMMRGMQHDAWLIWRFAPETETIPGPAIYLRVAVANMVIVERDSAGELAEIRGSFDAKAFDERRKRALARWNVPGRVMMPNFGTAWSRVLRYESARTTRPLAMTTVTSSGMSEVTATRSAS